LFFVIQKESLLLLLLFLKEQKTKEIPSE
jgi:hypothetical protein